MFKYASANCSKNSTFLKLTCTITYNLLSPHHNSSHFTTQQDFHGQMAEPSCDRLFDFDFEKKPGAERESDLSDAEVRRLMFAEVCSYRPCVNSDGKGPSSYTSPSRGGSGAKAEGKMDVDEGELMCV